MTWARALRAALRHRGLIAAGLTAAAVAAGLQAASPPQARTVEVFAAARDLPWGSALAAADLRRLALPAAAVPDGAVTDAAAVLGRMLAGPVRRGEPLTDLRLVGPALLDAAQAPGADSELVAAPIRIADPGAAALLRAGDTVDVLSAAAGPDPAQVVASAVRVLAVPAPGEDSPVLAEGALVVLATTAAVAARLARAATTSRLSLTMRAA